MRRNRPGTKAKDMYNWPEQDFNDMETVLAGESMFGCTSVYWCPINYELGLLKSIFPSCHSLTVQQYIQQQIRKDFTDVEAILEPPPGQDEAAWKYEHLRQFCNELNGMAVKLQNECDPKVCVQMTATEQWIFLCAAHREPKECSAIDYTLHTLHGAASLLNSNKHFPSRVSIKENSVQRLSSVARRVYRIFSHAYFHHRTLFDEFEGETYLCKRFTRYVTKYELMSAENLIVPIDSESTA